MPMNSGRPIIGRFASAGLGFLSSTCGLPLAGLMGSFSQTTMPQIPPPHLETLTRASPAWVSQTPDGSPPLCAKATGTRANKHAITKTNLAAIEFSMQSGLHNKQPDLRNAILGL